MSTQLNRKELIAQYKELKHDAGVYRVVNHQTGRYFLSNSSDINSIYNKFEFAKKVNSYDVMHKKLANDMKQYGFDSFSIEVLELLDITPEMTNVEIQKDLKILEAL
ncbi:hypothetical protein HNQ80_001294 [Anaerosolibacter carboniphilus]|uniref:GIY-YIG domain-containing protein n=1 Tax=Anaerosolibacter carboniphilus TaxID=1417629 RepID=A0A841KYJ7_9FIRM|nr:GIY-YIG nuclease family protein [Anaerosolibacter carboniphilus]MBB6215205.1 hypothetical protein [Anaerosolibacter carboniphilus]